MMNGRTTSTPIRDLKNRISKVDIVVWSSRAEIAIPANPAMVPQNHKTA